MGQGFRGTIEMKRRVEQIAKGVPKQVATGMETGAARVLETAQARTPVASGRLRDSGRVVPADTDDTAILVGITFDAPHAVYVHEDLDAEHATGQAKFLESALNEAAPTLARRIARQSDLAKLV